MASEAAVKLPIYMDNHATTRTDPRVLETMLPYFGEIYGNAASRNHEFGWIAEQAVDNARDQIAKLIGATAKEIVLTSGATESNNLAIKGVAEMYREKGNHIITEVTEHKCVLDTCKRLEKHGYRVTYLPVQKDGLIDLNQLQDAMFHTDAVQAAGKVPFNVIEDNVDLASISAHKIYGPKGVGALYVRRRNPRVQLVAQMDGGGHERGMRSGTLNVPGIVGMGKACELARLEMGEESARLFALRENLREQITSQLDEVYINGSMEHRLPGSINISFAYVEGESLLMGINDIAVSSGSACTSATLEPSYVLKALGAGDDLAHSSIRFGLGRFNTQAEVDYVAKKIVDVVRRLRELSPLYEMHKEGVDLSKVKWAAEPATH
jgi:cysteine desulfurase